MATGPSIHDIYIQFLSTPIEKLLGSSNYEIPFDTQCGLVVRVYFEGF